jgi:hypothetical protein
MAIAFDNADAAVAPGTASSITLSFTIGTGSNRFIAVLASQSIALVNIDSATYNGVTMTAHTQFETLVTARKVRLFTLLNPASGANDIVVTYANGTSRPGILVSSYSGVSGVQNVTNATGTATSPTWTVASAVNDLVGVLARGSLATSTMIWSSPAIERLEENITIMPAWGADEAGAASVTIDGTPSATETWAGTAFNMNVFDDTTIFRGGGGKIYASYGKH